ncbi:MAG: YeeE/YedE family protein [Flammeovirgaceae bacterium]|nr:YeeE/YedE family protein [Flammeovirgaceae bacterium]
MKYIRFLVIGLLFGIVMFKSQAVSWYRIFEMFRFESFHMYGIIGTALFFGVIIVQTIKRRQLKSRKGNPILFAPKNKSVPRYLIGGIIFGLGWALAGACPGPMYVLIGNGTFSILIVLLAAVLGTFTYGLVRRKLPH